MKPQPPKLWEIALVVIGSIIIVVILTKMARDLQHQPTRYHHEHTR